VKDVLAALERVVAVVKRHVDNGDAPAQILHSVSAIRNEARAPSDQDLGRRAIADHRARFGEHGVTTFTPESVGASTAASVTTVTSFGDLPSGVTVTPAPQTLEEQVAADLVAGGVVEPPAPGVIGDEGPETVVPVEKPKPASKAAPKKTAPKPRAKKTT